jgi:hypothetical protein
VAEDRQVRRVKKMTSKELPNQLDPVQLEQAFRELPPSAREALVSMARGSQANFDHLNNEQKRATQYHNEHAEETNFIKDEVFSHEHPSFNTKSISGFDQLAIDTGESGMWISTAAGPIGSGYRAGVDAYEIPTMVPTYIEKPCTIKRLRFEVITPLPAVQQDVKMFIYAGDYDGNWPDTLLYDGTDDVILCPTIGFKESGDIDVEVGAGWIWIGLATTRSAFGDCLNIWSVDNGWNSVSHGDVRRTGWWPFPQEEWTLDTGFVGNFNSISAFGFDLRDVPGPADPLPGSPGSDFDGFMDDWVNNQFLTSPFYSSYAPIIEYRVN